MLPHVYKHDTTFSGHMISMNDFGGVTTYLIEVCTVEESFLFDESLFILFRADRRSRINRRNTDAVNCALEHDGFGGGSEVVLAAIRNDGRTVLVRINCAHNATIYWDEILQSLL